MMARFKGHAFWRHKNRIIGKAQKHEDVTLQAYRTKKKRVYKDAKVWKYGKLTRVRQEGGRVQGWESVC